MVALARHSFPTDRADWAPLFAAVAASPGDGTPALILADWLDDQDEPLAAAAVRAHVPLLVARHRAAASFVDAVLAAPGVPVTPRPVSRFSLTRAAWVERVRDALRPLGIRGVTVARAAGWGGGTEVELRYPPGGFALPDGRGGGIPLAWSPTWREAEDAARLGLDAVMRRLFPDEPPRVVGIDGIDFETEFWRIVPRPPRRN